MKRNLCLIFEKFGLECHINLPGKKSPMPSSSTTRQVDHLMCSHPSQDGDGVNIRRLHDFGSGLDPFLMLDELKQVLREYHAGTLTG